MKKKLFLATLVAQTLSAQIISKDNAFATNGIHSITSNYAWSKILETSNGDIYYTYNKNNTTPTVTFISKLTTAGTIDTTFGNSGEIELPYGAHESQLKVLPDGKLLLYSFDSGSKAAAIIKMFPNGQLDNTFGVNGVAKVPDLNPDFNIKGYGITLQSNKIIVYGQETVSNPLQTPPERIYRLNENGSIDTTFGNNGFISHSGTLNLVAVDSQSNIVCFGSSKNNDTYFGATTKYTPNGLPHPGFGNNGTVYLNFNPGYTQSAILDSNNNIIFSNLDSNYSASLNKINADGTFDPSFVANFNSTFSFATEILSIVEKEGYYYLGGTYYGQTNQSFFISRLKQNGQMDPSFNYFVESNQDLGAIGDMIVNTNNIIANGSNHIVKYLLNNATLTTASPFNPSSSITIENPINQHLLYTSKDKVAKIEMYSSEGKILKTVKNSHSPVSDLPTGIYTATITFENGTLVHKKLIKK